MGAQNRGPTIGTGQENGNVQKLCIVGRYRMCLRVMLRKGRTKSLFVAMLLRRSTLWHSFTLTSKERALFYFDIQREGRSQRSMNH